MGYKRAGCSIVAANDIDPEMAWHYKQYSKSKELAEAEDLARKEKKGLWVDKEPVPPWEFRKTEREKSKK